MKLPSVHNSAKVREKLCAGMMLCAVGLCLPDVARAGAPQDRVHKESRRADTHEIEALETQWRSAMVHADTASLSTLLSDDFFGISANGTVTDKQQYLDRLTHHEYQFADIRLVDQKVRMRPTTAIVVSEARVSGQWDGRPMDGLFRYTKVYGREAGAWRVLTFEATRVSGPRGSDPDMQMGTPISEVRRPY